MRQAGVAALSLAGAAPELTGPAPASPPGSEEAAASMPVSASVQLVSSSYDEYADSIRHARLRGFILARETRPWRVSRCVLGGALLEHGVEGAPFVASGSAAPGTTSFYLSGSPGLPRFANGREVGDGSFVRWSGGEEVSVNVPRPGDWYALTVPVAEVEALTAVLTGGEPPPVRTVGLEVHPERLERLRSLCASAVQAVEAAAPGGLAGEARAELEATLLTEVIRASQPVRLPPGLSAPRISRLRVLGRLDQALAEHESEPLYVADLCRATGLPERTLRHIVVEQYGTSPMRLLRSRRLCRLREALLEAGDGGERVSTIARRCGFWHLSQLAVDYRRLFGELPSVTLRRTRRHH